MARGRASAMKGLDAGRGDAWASFMGRRVAGGRNGWADEEGSCLAERTPAI